MSILFLILKIIGWVLLCVLGLVLLLLLYALFSPISYGFRGNFLEDKEFAVSVHDLFHLVSFSMEKGKSKDSMDLRVLWMHLLQEEHSEGMKVDETMEEELLDPLESSPMTTEASEVTEDMVEEEQKHPEVEQSLDASQKKRKQMNETSKEEPAWRKKLRHLQRMFEDERAMEGFRVMLHHIGRLIRHLWPRQGSYNIEFSTGAPDTTGQVIAFISTLRFAYGKKRRLLPDFSSDEAYIRGNAAVSGWIRLIVPVISAACIFFNSNARRLIAYIKRL